MAAQLASWKAVGGRGRIQVLSEHLPVALRSAVAVY